MMKLFTAAYNA